MEVADQWRREWAGTAEYGKVTEGGVTRRIARAMEVLHASGPGARVRVMRAAYHSTAGPGTPASSYMLHSSRRVISSGFNLLEPSSLPIKPLEISSTPLESSPDSNVEIENYKVTEPDDLEISEPSKWKSASRGSSIRMPSEESSSTDNASIIDLDSVTNHKNVFRKHSYDSENSDITPNKRNSRVSPLLDAPITLSTLKYKSLLNSTNEWNNRRKSYSFEDTSPIDETIMQNNETSMESSTDSGICKSSEIVNDYVDDNTHSRYVEQKNSQDDSFKKWLSKNRSNTFYKGTKFKSHREHEIVTEDPTDNKIALQSTGKVSITLPITVETSDGYRYTKMPINEDSHRKAKKVEFCKTELHFAAETGKVNIIATDEKPPPSNDFRKRRSAFVPMEDMIEKPITLFGENINFQEKQTSELINHSYGEFLESDENTAATKSILKNKIPKPKPYLLGENMVFGAHDDLSKKDYLSGGSSVLTAVSLINRQLQLEKQSIDDTQNSIYSETHSNSHKNNPFRIVNKDPAKTSSSKDELYGFTSSKIKLLNNETIETEAVNPKKNISSNVQPATIQASLKTRQLKESDLTYFGINQNRKSTNEDQRRNEDEFKYNKNRFSPSSDTSVDNLFHSVRLIQQISSSVCNSESEDAPEYQNVPMNTNFAPVPTPRIRLKLDDKPYETDEVTILKPIIEHESEETIITPSRRTKFRRQAASSESTSRSLSEPRKIHGNNSLGKSHRSIDRTSRCDTYQAVKENENVHKLSTAKTFMHNNRKISEDDTPSYINLKNTAELRNDIVENNIITYPRRSQQREIEADQTQKGRKTKNAVNLSNSRNDAPKNKTTEKTVRRTNGANENTSVQNKQHSLKRNCIEKRAEKIDKLQGYSDNNKNDSKTKPEHKSRSFPSKDAKTAQDKVTSSENTSVDLIGNKDMKMHKRQSSKDKTRSRYETPKALQKLDPNSSIDKNSIKTDIHARPNSHRLPKRSEYVINYDDKNGTVSSICKIQGSGAPRKKKITKEIIKAGPKENMVRNKLTEIVALRK